MNSLAFWEKRLVALRKKLALYPAVNGGRRRGERHQAVLDAYQGVFGIVTDLRREK